MTSNSSGTISSTMKAAKSRREQFEEQLKDLQNDISSLSHKLSVPTIITANRFGNSSAINLLGNRSILSDNDSKLNVSFQSNGAPSLQNQSINGNSALNSSSLHHPNSSTLNNHPNNQTILDYQLQIDQLSNDLTSTLKERNHLSEQLQESRNEIEELKKGVVEFARLKAAFEHLKQDHEALKTSLESSERIRIQQKELIAVLQKANYVTSAADNHSILSFNSLSTISQRPDGDSVIVNQAEIPRLAPPPPSAPTSLPPQKSSETMNSKDINHIDALQHHAWLNLPINRDLPVRSVGSGPISTRLSDIPSQPSTFINNVNNHRNDRPPLHPQSSLIHQNIPKPSPRTRHNSTSSSNKAPSNTSDNSNNNRAPNSGRSKTPLKSTLKSTSQETAYKTSPNEKQSIKSRIEEEARKILSTARPNQTSKKSNQPSSANQALTNPMTSVNGSYATLKELYLQQQLQYQKQLQDAGVTPNVYPIQHILQNVPFNPNAPSLPASLPPATLATNASTIRPPLHPVMSASRRESESEREEDDGGVNTSREMGVNTDLGGFRSTSGTKKKTKKTKKKRSNSAPPAPSRWMFRAAPAPTTTTTFGKADRF